MIVMHGFIISLVKTLSARIGYFSSSSSRRGESRVPRPALVVWIT